MTVEEENVRLRAEVERLEQALVGARQVIATLEQRIAELERESTGGLPPFVKPNRLKRAERSQPPRKKRASDQNHARRREPATRVVEHAHEHCPECNYRLAGHSLDYSRQVIELPPPQPIEVIEHRVLRRYCPHCQCWQTPKLDLTGQVLGQGRFGVRLVSLIATLRMSLRLPLERIRDYLQRLHQLTISVGEIVYLLDQVRKTTQEEVAKLKREVQQSAIVHGDETGWREDGLNGYVWAFSTPGEQAVRYYEYDRTRSQSVLRRILANRFKGYLVSDFYVGYNDYECPKQRCWPHLLRLLHKRKEKFPDNPEVLAWVQAMRRLYDEANEWLEKYPNPSQQARESEYVALVAKLHELGLKYAQEKAHPCQALAKLVLRHEDELFQFVLVEGLASNNNLAERSIRPLVVMRKISGGSRSSNGSKTRMALASLFGTWQARGLNPFVECLNLLSQPSVPSNCPA